MKNLKWICLLVGVMAVGVVSPALSHHSHAMLTPKYREYFVQDVKAAAEGRIWGAGSFCLPGGFFPSLGAEEFIVTPEKVWTLAAGNGENYIRWIYTDGSEHTPTEREFVKWHGESIGFWNRDALIVHTNQIRGWKGGLSEFSDKLETVERYRRVGDRIEGEITLYDPDVLLQPVTASDKRYDQYRKKENR